MTVVSNTAVGTQVSFNVSDYSTTGSIAAQIAVFACKMAQDHRNSQRNGQENIVKYAEAERNNMMKQADEMRHAAGARLAGSIAQGALGVAGGTFQLHAAGQAIKLSRQADSMQSQQQQAGGPAKNEPGGTTDKAVDGLQDAAAKSQKKNDAADGASEPLLSGKQKDSSSKPEDGVEPGTNLGGSPGANPAARGGGGPDEGASAQSFQSANTLNNQAMAINQKAAAWGMITNSVAQLAKGSGDFIAAIDDAQKMELDADKKRIAAAANVNNQNTSIHGEVVSKALDISGQVITAIQPPRFA